MTVNYAILVTDTGASADTALNFIRTALTEGHRIHRVFFLHKGVAVGTTTNSDSVACWQQLQSEHQLDLVVCASSAIKRQVFDQREAKRRQQPQTLAEGFCLSGLGQWLDACVHSDRQLRFGG